MTIKKHIKTGIRLIIESDANITTLIIRASKKQLLTILDTLIPDDVEEEPEPTTWEPLDLRKMK